MLYTPGYGSDKTREDRRRTEKASNIFEKIHSPLDICLLWTNWKLVTEKEEEYELETRKARKVQCKKRSSVDKIIDFSSIAIFGFGLGWK